MKKIHRYMFIDLLGETRALCGVHNYGSWRGSHYWKKVTCEKCLKKKDKKNDK